MEPKLTTGDWAEIYYALDSKARAIQRGEYGPEDQVGWVQHLREIMGKITAAGIPV